MSIPRIIIKKKKNENAVSALRRFSRKTRDIIKIVKGQRYYEREDSELRRKRSALRKIADGKKFAKLYKLGLISGKRQ
ncbi:MAG: hypothetical protein LRY41_03535 [Candidatus Pacebacteria bacterium]|nr:hypothetical protein [Candidatus Paceibacterota bacterium]MCD8508300.1 hypothetical protein [Candidatus Paceibacterota bacterium]MCD8528362.1 hypothetical protein [Candidatus Paceibacterota bacterium]MCD8563790.1 hypothetical protein [Candidatus Paceibacterota bacterium]